MMKAAAPQLAGGMVIPEGDHVRTFPPARAVTGQQRLVPPTREGQIVRVAGKVVAFAAAAFDRLAGEHGASLSRRAAAFKAEPWSPFGMTMPPDARVTRQESVIGHVQRPNMVTLRADHATRRS